jgi:hypothetical protein
MPFQNEILPAVEFQALPLEYCISAPLVAAVKAQTLAAETTLNFIKAMAGTDGKPAVVSFNVSYKEVGADGASKEKTAEIAAPLLSIVPVPHIRIDSLTIHFKYEVTQTVRNLKDTEKGIELDFKTGGLLSAWISGTLKGKLSSKATDESTMNRSGMLEITVHASEAPMPEGLAKILSFLGNAVQSNLPKPV